VQDYDAIVAKLLEENAQLIIVSEAPTNPEIHNATAVQLHESISETSFADEQMDER